MTQVEIEAHKDLETACCDCGIALYANEIAGEVLGRFIDYFGHSHGNVDAVYCHDCWKKFCENQGAEKRSALAKRRAIESVTFEDETKAERLKPKRYRTFNGRQYREFDNRLSKDAAEEIKRKIKEENDSVSIRLTKREDGWVVWWD